MAWETLGFLSTAIVAGLYILFKIKKDIFPYALKKWINRMALSNWQKSLPQKMPVYDFYAAKSTEESGLLPKDMEYVLEKPEELNQPGDADDLSFYGIDDDGNALVAKISKLWKGWTEVSLCLNVDGKSYSVSYQGPSANQHEFSLGNFKLEMVEPFRAWRLWYNGSMEKDQDEEGTDKDDLVHVTLNFLWKPLDNPTDLQKNANLDLLSDYISDNGSFGNNLTHLRAILPPGYLQFGSFHGNVDVNNIGARELYLYGNRLRRHLSPIESQLSRSASGPSGNMNNFGKDNVHDRLELFGICASNGNAFRLMSFNDDWIDGQVFYSSFEVRPITEIDISAKPCNRDISIPKVFTISDKKSSQTVEIWPRLQKLQGPHTTSLDVILLKLLINGKPGRGILIRRLDSIAKKSIALLENPGYFNLITKSCKNIISTNEEEGYENVTKSEIDFVDFCSKSCQNIALVGGKGASLARLAELVVRQQSQFKTAKGFCVTTNLFRKMVDMQRLKDIFCNDEWELEQMCSEAISLIKSSGVESKLIELIQPSITRIFGDASQILRFAVRSSGILEDGTDLSCAGQNETFLGVAVKSIPVKIVDCWASLFTHQSVGYRLNHGQPAVSEMGVVIQEMVDATSAGVLFTADPRTGNPFEMVLTANYGLGESVVSASCDPDTIILLRSRQSYKTFGSLRSSKDSLKVGKKSLGDKKTKIVLAFDGKLTEECVTNDKDAQTFCLEDAKAVELGCIGVKIEKELGQLKPVDIEWALSKKGELYILQCRAMTSLDAWTDFEILHQFDSSIRTKIDRMTTANTGEVVPKPIFPMSIETLGKTLELNTIAGHCRRTGESMCPMMYRSTPIYGQRLHLNVYHMLYRFVDEKPTPELACVDLAVFGRKVIDDEMHQISLERHGLTSWMSKLRSIIHAFKTVRGSSKVIQLGNEQFSELELDYDSIPQTSKSVYDKITNDLLVLSQAGQLHIYMSEVSSITLVFAFITVTEGREVKDWTPSLFEDAGTLLSVHSTVESAEMPGDIDALGQSIVELGKNPKAFLNTNGTTDAISWLRDQVDLGDALDKFFKKHGHRAIAEMDLGNKSWKTDPTPLINLLKNIVKNKLESKNPQETESSVKKPVLTEDELLNTLKTPLKNGTRRFLKFLLPYSREAVINRERSKSLFVRTIDQFKQGYYRLGQLMTKERIIPDENLLRHLTHSEMGLLIKKDITTSTILYKAMRRMKLYPSIENLDYPEISVGLPKPIDNAIPIEVTEVIKATPVSSGKVQGIAKVCLSVEEASELIRPGDILITKGTDIAWSPFFPLLGGVVTELGGLISHGAVVAREYGLPCIVGAVNATKIFKTGDQVILDTSTGTLAKVKSK